MKSSKYLLALMIAVLPVSVWAEEVMPNNYNPQEPEAEIAPADDGLEESPDADNDVTESKPLKAENTGSVVDQNMEEGDVEEEDADKWYERKRAVLQGLNKVTARTSELKMGLNEKVRFGNLEITVEKCLRGPQDEKDENTALITIHDEIPGQERAQVFRGWMFSSSPAISALEHPIYDVILLSCGNPVKPAKAEPAKTPAKTPPKK